MSPLPWTTNQPQHCSRIVPPSLSKWRLDPAMTSNGFKWGCARATLSSFIFGVELTTAHVSHSMVFHTGDTKSVQELEVFQRIPGERLRLCCGIQCTDSLHPNGPAALKLLRFAIGIETVCCENEEQRAATNRYWSSIRASNWWLSRSVEGAIKTTSMVQPYAICIKVSVDGQLFS